MRLKILAMLVTAAATLPQLQQMTARFAPALLRVDTSKLSPGDRDALARLIEAGRVVNHIFLQQIWSGNLALESKLRAGYFRSRQSAAGILPAQQRALVGSGRA